MENKKRLIEIPEDGIIRIPIMAGEAMVGEKRIDLSHIPTVDAEEVVHGKWVKKTADCVYYYACSECEEPVLKSRWGHDCFTRYCPNCGAKMDGDVNG